MRPCVVRHVLSGMRASREAEHHSKTTRGQGDLPRSQPLKMWIQFGGLCMRRTIKEIAAIVNVLYGTVQTILTCDLNMFRVAAKFVPRFLTTETKEHRVAICEELRQRALDAPSFMSRVITGDESWVYGYDPETKHQSSQWKSPGSPRPKKARQSRSALKSMLIVFFDIIEGLCTMNLSPKARP